MNIKTTRCFLRPFNKEDIEVFMQYRNNLEWMKFQGFKGLSKEEYEARLLKEVNFKEGIQLAIIENSLETLIGDIYLKQENEETYWMGYTIAPEYAKQGYGFEITSNLIEDLKQNGAKVIHARVLVDNIPSIHLLEKLNFQYILPTDEELQYTLYL